jgi:uncharacterized protein YjiS (DUF1127 family)
MSNINAATITKQLNTHALAMHNNTLAKQPRLSEGLFARWRRWQRMRRDATWLQNQPDYLLRDIGISRSEISAIIRDGRYR